jgi:PucR-like helix-turn-helix protein/diguanylate cyclase with GGDEF domain
VRSDISGGMVGQVRNRGARNALAGQLEPVAQRLEARAEELATRQVQAMRANFSTYRTDRTVPDAPLIASALRNVQRVVTTLREGRAPTPEEVHEAWVARERTEQGVPSTEQITGYRFVQRLLADAVIEQAETLGLDQKTVTQAVRLLWEMTDAVTARLLVVQYEAELEMARYDEVQRLEFLRGLLAGTTSPAELHSRAPAYGLVFDHPYYAVRARPADPRDREALKRAIEATGRLHGLSVLAGVIEGEVAAVTPQRPDLSGLAATAGLGGPASLEAAEHAYHSASRMLSVALQFGATGAYGLDDLSLKVAVASEPELGSLLMRQYLDPLAGEGEFGELLEETLREFLANGQRILETSKRLGIHANTLRYRLDRFEKLTGTSLDQPRAVVEVWWALECRTMERRSRQQG